MSTLWTPGGEIPIADRRSRADPTDRAGTAPTDRATATPAGPTATPRPADPTERAPTAPTAPTDPAEADADTDADTTDSLGPTEQDAADFDLDSLTPEEREQAEEYIRQMAEARERLKETPAAAVVANHAMGLYELGALHLTSQPPNFTEAMVAIDALGALLDGMRGRLGNAESTLREGLSQIRMAFVQLKKNPGTNPGPPAE